jgi:hypothetical protein
MARTLKTTLQVRAAFEQQNTGDLGNTNFSPDYFFNKSLASGTTINCADLLWTDAQSISAGATVSVDLYDFAGLVDGVGVTVAQVEVVGLLVENASTTVGDILHVGGGGAASCWNSFFNGDDDAKAVVHPGGLFLAYAPAAAAYAVADTTNHILNFYNAGSNSVTFNLLVFGRSA